ncbi:hypothetical protein [Micromonospora sp. NPDC004704]
MDWAEFLADNIPEPVTVGVEPYEGTGAFGAVFGDLVQVPGCVVEDTRRLIRVQTQDAAGAEQVSSTTVFGPPDLVAPPGSRITLPGRTSRVLAAGLQRAHGLPLPEHWELSLE